VSFALTGPVSDVLGVDPTLVIAGLLGAVLFAALLFVPGVRDPERGLVQPVETEPELAASAKA